MANLVALSGEWDETSPEVRALTLASIDVVFPGKFASESDVGDVFVMQELRTQIFVQQFLEDGASEDWDTTIRLGETFKLNDPRSTATGVCHAEQNVAEC